MSSVCELRINDISKPEAERGKELVCLDEHSGLYLSWKWTSQKITAKQTAYQILILPPRMNGPDLLIWDSGKIPGSKQIRVEVPIGSLDAFTCYQVSVRVWLDGESIGTTRQSFRTGRIGRAAWKAAWISLSGRVQSKADSRPAWFKKILALSCAPASSLIYVTALGWYRLLVNGVPVNEGSQVPRFTPYDKLVEYQCYDVNTYLHAGPNSITIVVGDGRFRGGLGMSTRRNSYGDRVAAFAQLSCLLPDGSQIECVTDATWVAGYGPITAADTKLGERVDFRIWHETYAEWTALDVSPSEAELVTILPSHPRKLVAEEMPAVRHTKTLSPRRLFRSPKNLLVADFGQNLTGVASILLPARTKRGVTAPQSITLTFSEVLSPQGEVDVNYLEFTPVPPTDQAFLGDVSYRWSPWFTVRGFRYVEIKSEEDILHGITESDVSACVYTTDIDISSSFECSNPCLKRLHENTVWSWRGNNLDTPMDCPTRERSGWTGDIQVFSPTALLMSNAVPVLRRYLKNLALEQLPTGQVPIFIPSELGEFMGPVPWAAQLFYSAAGWGDASVILPWNMYHYTGDSSILRAQYQSMQAWIRSNEELAGKYSSIRRFYNRTRVGPLEKYIVDRGVHFGEWFRPGESGLLSIISNLLFGTPVVPTAYFARSSRLFAQAANVLGMTDDAERYSALADDIKLAYRRAFVSRGGLRIGDDRQDDYVRALAFDLLSVEERNLATRRLVELIEANDFHLDTGFLSTPLLLPTLAAVGRVDVAYRILLKDTKPSWLYSVKRDATTVWETWEGFNKVGKAHGSHNHYSYGSVCQFFYEWVCGITPAEPGYSRIKIQPYPGGGLLHARCSVETPYGRAVSGWQLGANGEIKLEVEIPSGSTAEVYIQDRFVDSISSGFYTFTGKL